MAWKAVILTAGILSLLNNCYAEVPWVKAIYFQNWGGLNDQLSQSEIQDNEATDIQNIIFDTGGALVKRYGFDPVPSDTVQKAATGSVVAITGLSFYHKNNGNKFVVAIANNDNKAVAMKKNWDSGPASGAWNNIDFAALPSSYSNNYLADFAVAEDNLIITIPSTTGHKPFKWPGSGFVTYLTSDSDCPTASLVEYHKNHLFLSGNPTYPSRVYFSALDNISDFTATDFFDVQTSDGSRVRGIISAYDSLYIFKDKSIWRLSGSERDTFVLQEMVYDIGTLSQQSICIVNNIIYFTTPEGKKAVYDGAYTVKFASDKIDNTINTKISSSRSAYALGINFEDNFYGSVSGSGSGTNNLVLLFDTTYNAWTKFNGINANAWCVAEDSTEGEILVFGDYSGYVDSYPSSNYYDGNATTGPISAFYQTKWFRYSDLALGDKYWRLLKTYALSETIGDAVLYAECRSDYETSGRVVEIDLSESGAKWDTALWDVDLWSGQSLIVGRNEIEKGKSMFQIKYYNDSANQGFTIFGWEIFIEPTNRI
jgi:hypothetical protein